MKVTAQRSLLAGALAAALLMAAPSPSSADPNGPPPDRAAPASSAAELLGGAIGNRGLISFRDVFAGVQIDVPGNRVVVWATDGARGRKLAAAGRKDLPEAATRGVNVDVRQSKHTRARLEAARAALWPRLDGAAVSISVPSDGSGLVVAATDPDRTRRLLKQGTPTLSEISADDVKVKIGQVMRATDRHNEVISAE